MAAEFAAALPVVVVLLAVSVQVLFAAAQQVALQDAAADAARLLGRGESTTRAATAVQGVVPHAQFHHRVEGEIVCVTASVNAAIAGLIHVPIAATSCALTGGK